MYATNCSLTWSGLSLNWIRSFYILLALKNAISWSFFFWKKGFSKFTETSSALLTILLRILCKILIQNYLLADRAFRRAPLEKVDALFTISQVIIISKKKSFEFDSEHCPNGLRLFSFYFTIFGGHLMWEVLSCTNNFAVF